MKHLLLLGASGSIGSQTLDIIRHDPKAFSLIGFSVGYHDEIVESLISEFSSIRYVYLIDKKRAQQLATIYPNIVFYSGENGLSELSSTTEHIDMMVNALVGFAGFMPSLIFLSRGIDVALANKESLVVGGFLLKAAMKKSGARIFPIDSEHVALAKCLAHNRSTARRLILTASGGSFRSLLRQELEEVTPAAALNHPTWKMGPKITIDSATMMNKGFEIIEAYYLFNFPLDKISILMHDESRVHSLVEFNDGSFLADIGPSDMRIPIAYALYEGKRKEKTPHQELSLDDFATMHFHAFNPARYPAVELARNALKIGGSAPAVLNAANEVAVAAFLRGNIPFTAIEKIVDWALTATKIISSPTAVQLVDVDRQTRHNVEDFIKGNY